MRVPPVEFSATLTLELKNGFLFPRGIFQAREELSTQVMLSLSGTHVRTSQFLNDDNETAVRRKMLRRFGEESIQGWL